MTNEELISSLTAALAAKDQIIAEQANSLTMQSLQITELMTNGNGTVPGPVYDEACAARDAALAKLAAINAVLHPVEPSE